MKVICTKEEKEMLVSSLSYVRCDLCALVEQCKGDPDDIDEFSPTCEDMLEAYIEWEVLNGNKANDKQGNS